ncbi:MAG: hypothetical protein NC321_11920 [Clostridium sp.]|nr:hypothetical protein [Clostridium sp.]
MKKYQALSCAVACSLLLCACGRETASSQETEATSMSDLPDLSGAANADEVLELLIEDEGFRECVHYKLGIEEDDLADEVLRKLENCESITLEEAPSGNAIYSLEALSLMPNLTWFGININSWDDSAIEDFTPIAQLSKLEELYINDERDEQIDLSFLGQMHTITALFLPNCKMADFSFLEEMPQLQRLSFYETPIEDLAVLEKLPNLVQLSLCGNENVKNIEAVGTLTEMQDLNIQRCGIKDISFLSGSTKLRNVSLNGNFITDITPLAGLHKLEHLELSDNGISDISALENLSSLYNLALDDNEIQDISALAKLPHLNEVRLFNNLIEDFTPLADKEELMYAAVFGNPAKSLEPIFMVPMLRYTTTGGVSEEEKAFVTDWLAEHYPGVEQFFTCNDFIEGDLNHDGRRDIAFVATSEAFDDKGDYLRTLRMFILLQQEDGSWKELANTPEIASSEMGGTKGDLYYGAFIQEGYLLIQEGWGGKSGWEQNSIYEYHNGTLRLASRITVDDDYYAVGYDVNIQDERSGEWQHYAIAWDGNRNVRVDIEDTEHPAHKAFPDISLYPHSYYIYEKEEPRITSSEALDRVLEEVLEDAFLAVKEELPYAEWQKEGYERLVCVELPDYYYTLPETRHEADGDSPEWEGDYLYYDRITRENGELSCHLIRLVQEDGVKTFWLNDETGEIERSE